ncbi:TPA_asm: D-alanine--poly(phosphoribitol) ligase subunit DltC [Listeria monocytogenes]|uniref:D-alanine--poly(phosphoribitol) ligase subunit DltC n=1 Tax=Listeria monocytogenes TaxID=1639 RepID=UPI000BDF1EDC|nr:D-alanine--poly(phosphoribitol) ligase subunit DltC [Listeria monocytogenes]EEN9582640.1 D-alanine--poly(phosphoribitol) ligase subunit DltC [Listeria monocytogenes]PCV13905.1 D-alanine--poly(phosphoribitol) ligase subunit 2 [Listeria monocytogenes]PCV26189.1 D-alanine--poly(phosphoribitol) ligase subunit 2 [Listeria monocytogenes]HAA3013096.1 D-alanine--poly(phosphoribitol) ligase subunit 2 [Listeria monocytogenes]HAB8122306.1 D-alanine--poly(phosphoribitol) ligase subunit DltC [Listeria m
MAFRENVLGILEEITETDEVVQNTNIKLFDEGLLDSMATVQLLIEIEEKLDITVPVSEFDRDEWATPEMIITQLEALK